MVICSRFRQHKNNFKYNQIKPTFGACRIRCFTFGRTQRFDFHQSQRSLLYRKSFDVAVEVEANEQRICPLLVLHAEYLDWSAKPKAT